MGKRTFAVVVVSPTTLFREGISRILDTSGFRIAASAACVDERFLGSLPRNGSILLIIDACNDHDAAIGQIVLFKAQYPAVRIAVLAERYQLSDVMSACRAGVHGYFAKVFTCEAFVKSLELIMLGETILPVAVLALLLDKEDPAPAKVPENRTHELVRGETAHEPRLSPQENSILHCLIKGDSNKVIARKLQITEATVKVHVKAILRKVRAQNRTQAAIWAMSNDRSVRVADNGHRRGEANLGLSASLG